MREIALSNSDTLKPVLEYATQGGKRIRSALVILSCEAVGGSDEQALYGAAAVELLHNYSLMIDDIIDRGKKRRGKKTVIEKFGLSATECTDIAFASSLFEAGNLCGNRVVEILARTMKILADGEIKDVLFEQTGRNEPFYNENKYKKITINDYHEMVSKKTAELIKASCEIGAILGDAGEDTIQCLKDYGHNIGIAFQITDDILDIFGEEKKFGKKIGKDILEHKIGNIVILLADNEEVYSILKQKKPNVKKAIKILRKDKARERAETEAKRYIKKAKNSLKKLPKSEAKNELIKLADFILKRSY